VVRVFINNGLTNATAANNALIGEIAVPATATTSQGMQPAVELPLNFALPAGYVINVTLGATIAAGVVVTCIGGDY
jgi:hypothetical protein